MEVDTLSVPLSKAADGKGMPQVVRSRSDTAFVRLHAGLAENPRRVSPLAFFSPESSLVACLMNSAATSAVR